VANTFPTASTTNVWATRLAVMIFMIVHVITSCMNVSTCNMCQLYTVKKPGVMVVISVAVSDCHCTI